MTVLRMLASCAVLATLGLLAACAESAAPPVGANQGKYYSVMAERTAFYRYGPQQENGADKKLSRDTLVTIVNSSFGYCKVRLLDGEQGYVAREDIHPASPELIAAATAPSPIAATSRFHRSHFNSNDPRLIAPPEALPLDLPEPTPIPETQSSPP